MASSIIEDLRGKHKRFTFNDIKDNIADSPQIKKSDLTLLTKSFVRKSLSEFRMNALGNKGRSDFNGNISIPPPPPACFLETSVDNLPLPPPPLPANLLLHSNKSTNPVARKRKFDVSRSIIFERWWILEQIWEIFSFVNFLSYFV